MISRYVRSGDKIEIRRKSGAAKQALSNELCTSRVVSVGNDDTLFISEPFMRDGTVEFETGEQLELRFVISEGSYICSAAVLETEIRNGSMLFEIKIITEPKKNQRRRFFRLEKIMPVTYLSMEDEGTEHSATMINVSAGGIKFCTDVQIPVGMKSILKLNVGEGSRTGEDIMELQCKIIDSHPVANRVVRYDNRAVFLNMKREEVEKVVKFVFFEERKRKRNERDFY